MGKLLEDKLKSISVEHEKMNQVNWGGKYCLQQTTSQPDKQTKNRCKRKLTIQGPSK